MAVCISCLLLLHRYNSFATTLWNICAIFQEASHILGWSWTYDWIFASLMCPTCLLVPNFFLNIISTLLFWLSLSLYNQVLAQGIQVSIPLWSSKDFLFQNSCRDFQLCFLWHPFLHVIASDYPQATLMYIAFNLSPCWPRIDQTSWLWTPSSQVCLTATSRRVGLL